MANILTGTRDFVLWAPKKIEGYVATRVPAVAAAAKSNGARVAITAIILYGAIAGGLGGLYASYRAVTSGGGGDQPSASQASQTPTPTLELRLTPSPTLTSPVPKPTTTPVPATATPVPTTPTTVPPRQLGVLEQYLNLVAPSYYVVPASLLKAVAATNKDGLASLLTPGNTALLDQLTNGNNADGEIIQLNVNTLGVTANVQYNASVGQRTIPLPQTNPLALSRYFQNNLTPAQLSTIRLVTN